MNNIDKLKIRSGLVITGCLSGGLTIVFSLISIVLCTLALIYRFNCSSGLLGSSNGGQYFLLNILRIYILKDDCENALFQESFTTSHTVYILTITTLVFSVVTFFTAIILISALNNEKPVQYVDVIVYTYVGLCFASFVVDLTFGVHFGMDYQSIRKTLVVDEPGLDGNYQKDLIRLGAFILMTVCLKGYIGHIINIVLLVLLVSEFIQYQKKISEDEHSIHKLGVLSAFSTQSRTEDPWNSQRNDNIFMGYQKPVPKRIEEDSWNSQRNELFMGRGIPRTNPAFINDEPSRIPYRENGEVNRPSNRSDSWLHNQINSGPALGARPFSYLEEPKKPERSKSPTSANDPQWRREPWASVPPVPDPDYSPPPRRLKSALKSNYL